MAKEPKKIEEAGEAFLDESSKVQLLSHEFPFPRDAVWKALRDGDTWTKWLPITKVEWTSPEPFGVGTTRTVWIGKDVVEEVFIAWDEGHRMAFRFDRTTLPVKAFVEDYQLHETPGGCRLDWRFRGKAPFILGPIIHGQMKSSGRKGLPKLEAYIRDNPAKFDLS
ncbi:MAG: SRPBCC family protein [Henriciella sp.]|uniref:SRPBCC family protein n=1 Tax=Henriciella sp. TaxID=1968823 RepID=UPI0032EE7CD0